MWHVRLSPDIIVAALAKVVWHYQARHNMGVMQGDVAKLISNLLTVEVAVASILAQAFL